MRLSPRTVAQVDSPIGDAYALVGERSGRHEFLDLAQAAPAYPAAPSVVEHIVTVARDAHGGDYVGQAGLGKLREVFAAELSDEYAGRVHPDHVVVTAGCNQAFCLVMSVLAEPGDEVVVPLPAYFNHDMWLRMNGIRPVYLEPGPDLVPTADAAEALLTARTRAIVLVTPNNPTGVTIPPAGIAAFAELAVRRGIALVVDETYRSFRDRDDPAHPLFARPDWEDTVVSLHSFSKDLAIAGYRVGAVVASPALGREVLKVLDCVAIGAPRIGQEAAWAGLTTARQWRTDRAADVAARRRAFTAVMAERPGGFELLSCGGFFAWVRHPFPDRPTGDVVRELVVGHDVLTIPGTAFTPDDRGAMRISVGQLDEPAAADFAGRLAALGAGSRTRSA